MNANHVPTSEPAAKHWAARWAASLTAPLYSLRMRGEVDREMRDFAQTMPKYHAVLMAGLLHDLISTIDPVDPFRNMYKDDRGVIRLPGGEAFGSWHNGVDLMPPSKADVASDIALAPMAEPLSDNSVEFYWEAAHSWEAGRDYLVELAEEAKRGQLQQQVHETAEDAIRWALLRSQAYGFDGVGFFPITASAWINRTPAVVNGEPFDESRMLRLRSGAAVADGTYDAITYGPQQVRARRQSASVPANDASRRSR